MKKLFYLLAGIALPLLGLVSCKDKLSDEPDTAGLTDAYTGAIMGTVKTTDGKYFPECSMYLAPLDLVIDISKDGKYSFARLNPGKNYWLGPEATESLDFPYGTGWVSVSVDGQTYVYGDGNEGYDMYDKEGNVWNESITVTAGKITRVDFVCPKVGSIDLSCRDKETHTDIKDAEVELLPLGLKKTTNREGECEFWDLEANKTYTLKIHKDGYADYTEEVYAAKWNEKWEEWETPELSIELEPLH
ncbi:MAG: hypothetical protein NC048_08040 [Bacteroides sp.]|nr:hypothetical protein [Ruminococcus flavefaciens]MCM1555429.1 hypothetical protein [Bacteroides sp.]